MRSASQDGGKQSRAGAHCCGSRAAESESDTLTYLVDGEPLPVAVRLQRIAALREAAGADGLAALVIFSYGARSGMGTHGHLRYLLDFTSGGPPAVLVLPIGKELAVGVTAPFDPPWMRELS